LLDDDAYEIRAGDCIVYKSSHEAHTTAPATMDST
jgi:hypothetical protein